MNAILLLAALLQTPDFNLNGDVPDFTLNGGDVPIVLRPTKLAEPTRLPLFYGYSIPNCPNCPVAKKQTERLQFPHVEWKGEAPAEVGIKYYPAFHWELPDGKWKKLEGWYGLDKTLALYDDSMNPAAGVRESSPHGGNAPAARVVVKSRGLYYGSHPSGWSWPGDLRHHLATTHGYDAGYLAGLSDAQVIAIHDADHNGGGSGGRQRRMIGFFNTR